MFDDLLTIGAVIGLILLALAPFVGIMLILIFILKCLYKVYKMNTYRYSYYVWNENGTNRDSGTEPLSESHALMIENGLMEQGLKILLNYNDTDFNKVQNVINQTRDSYKNILKEPIDNKTKVI